MRQETITTNDFLFEVLTEELPPKSLHATSLALLNMVSDELKRVGLAFTTIHPYATPRRLAIHIENLSSQSKAQTIEKRGPAVAAAFDEHRQPTPACIGFAKSCGVAVDDLMTISTPQGQWVGVKITNPGKTVAELLPDIITKALMQLPFKKRMRWGEGETLFVRPIRSIIMLYGDETIDTFILGCAANRVTLGHRFMSNDPITIPHAANYASLLKTEGFVIASFDDRKAAIISQSQKANADGVVTMNEDLLNEVTGLVEWPVVLHGHFEDSYLELPPEVLISAMEDHQRYFAVKSADGDGKLMAKFVFVSNIESQDPMHVVRGNERVLRARLSDAAFFYVADQKESLFSRVEKLKGILFQAKLGSLHDKAERLSQLCSLLAKHMHCEIAADAAARAGLLAKADLTSQMVNEFPELQGVMGGYYALHDGEAPEIADAIRAHYQPRFAGDSLPTTPLGQALAMADKIDTIVGCFGVGQQPTGDKDPFGLRRAALGVLRILIEKEIDVDLKDILNAACGLYQVPLTNTAVINDVLSFMQERLRSFYQDQGISADVFVAVLAVEKSKPFDINQRIVAVQHFKNLPEAAALSQTNKRVSNLLEQQSEKLSIETINDALFEFDEEKVLATEIAKKEQITKQLHVERNYVAILTALAALRDAVDAFFDHVLVLTEDKARRQNRLLMLNKLRRLFLQVADIALLQSS